MKKLRKAAERIAKFGAEQNKLATIPEGYDIIDLNKSHNENARLNTHMDANFAPPTAILMHKEGSVQHIYKTLKKIK